MNAIDKYLGTISKSFWFQWVPGVVLGMLTIILLATGVISPYYLIATFVGWVLVCGLGIAVGYHRVFSHRTHQLPVWKENIILFLATSQVRAHQYSGWHYIVDITTAIVIPH